MFKDFTNFNYHMERFLSEIKHREIIRAITTITRGINNARDVIARYISKYNAISQGIIDNGVYVDITPAAQSSALDGEIGRLKSDGIYDLELTRKLLRDNLSTVDNPIVLQASTALSVGESRVLIPAALVLERLTDDVYRVEMKVHSVMQYIKDPSYPNGIQKFVGHVGITGYDQTLLGPVNYIGYDIDSDWRFGFVAALVDNTPRLIPVWQGNGDTNWYTTYQRASNPIYAIDDKIVFYMSKAHNGIIYSSQDLSDPQDALRIDHIHMSVTTSNSQIYITKWQLAGTMGGWSAPTQSQIYVGDGVFNALGGDILAQAYQQL